MVDDKAPNERHGGHDKEMNGANNANGRLPTLNSSFPNAKAQDALLRFEEVVANVLTSRTEFFRKFMDPRRDIQKECGHPAYGGTQDPWQYQHLYDRSPIANRVVRVMPEECWQVQPKVYEDEDPEVSTEFEEAWNDLPKQLRMGGGPAESHYGDEAGSPIWEYLKRVDILSGIGSFGILLFGFDDGLPLNVPVKGFLADDVSEALSSGSYPMPTMPGESFGGGSSGNPNGPGGSTPYTGMTPTSEGSSQASTPYSVTAPYGPALQGTDAQYFHDTLMPESPNSSQQQGTKQRRKLLFIRVFPESLVQIVRYESRFTSPRFGQPVMYRVTLNDPTQIHGGVGLPTSTVEVHWSRVLHVADNRTSSEVFGNPRMQAVLDRLLDLQKLYGGSAEMYWQGAFPGISFETDPALGGDVPVNLETTKATVENYMNGLQRYLALVGMTAKTLSPQVVDPTPQINIQVEAICIQLGIPKRVFMGSERGELASSQDDAKFNDRIRERQLSYLTPQIVVPFVDRLIQVGVLPAPQMGSRLDQVGEATSSDVGAGLAPSEDKKAAPTGLPSASPSPTGNADYPASTDSDKQDPTSGGNGPDPNKSPVSGRDNRPSNVQAAASKERKPGFHVHWGAMDSMTDKDKAQVAQSQTAALAQYVSGGVEALVPPADYLTRIMKFDEEEVAAILDSAQKLQEEMQAQEQALAEEQGFVPHPPDGYRDPTMEPDLNDPRHPLNQQDEAGGGPPTGNAKDALGHGSEKRGGSSQHQEQIHPSHVIDKAKLALMAYFNRDRNEHAIIMDDSGQELGKIHGGGQEVDPESSEHSKLFHTAGKNIHFHHNHPVNAPLSPGDITTFAGQKGVKAIYAHTPDGTTYAATKVPGREAELGDRAKKLFSELHGKTKDKWLDELGDRDPTPEDRAQFRNMLHEGQKNVLKQLADEGLMGYSVTPQARVQNTSSLVNLGSSTRRGLHYRRHLNVRGTVNG